MEKRRKCGDCRECCITLEVEALAKQADEPCQHLCGGGCAIYEKRPQACAAFTCAWREGLLAYNDRPNRTHMVVWLTKMNTQGGMAMEVLQCNIRSGFKRHKKTYRQLVTWSFKMPVLIVQDAHCTILSHGKEVGTWHQDDFVNLDFEGQKIVSLTVKPRSEILSTPELEKEYRTRVAANVEVTETDPEYRKTQLKYVQERI